MTNMNGHNGRAPFDVRRADWKRDKVDAPEEASGLDLDSRVLGRDGGLLRLDAPELAARAVAAVAGQARRQLVLLTPDLEPALYDQPSVLQAVRRLAVDRAGHLPVRVLVIDPESAIRRSLRLIELARRLTSSVQIAKVPDELAEDCDFFLLADQTAYCHRRHSAPRRLLVDFASPAEARALQRDFDGIWEQAGTALELRQLHL